MLCPKLSRNQGISPACVTCCLTYDMIGTVRMITNESQQLIARHDYVPFGEEIPNGSAGPVGNFGYPSDVTQGFTGQEADGGTAQLDFFNARHLAAVTGAFRATRSKKRRSGYYKSPSLERLRLRARRSARHHRPDGSVRVGTGAR